MKTNKGLLRKMALFVAGVVIACGTAFGITSLLTNNSIKSEIEEHLQEIVKIKTIDVSTDSKVL